MRKIIDLGPIVDQRISPEKFPNTGHLVDYAPRLRNRDEQWSVA